MSNPLCAARDTIFRRSVTSNSSVKTIAGNWENVIRRWLPLLYREGPVHSGCPRRPICVAVYATTVEWADIPKKVGRERGTERCRPALAPVRMSDAASRRWGREGRSMRDLLIRFRIGVRSRPNVDRHASVVSSRAKPTRRRVSEPTSGQRAEPLAFRWCVVKTGKDTDPPFKQECPSRANNLRKKYSVCFAKPAGCWPCLNAVRPAEDPSASRGDRGINRGSGDAAEPTASRDARGLPP